MRTPNRLVATLLIACASGVVATAPADAAKKTKPATAKAILKDCTKDGTINKRYRLADLKKAQKQAKKSKSKYEGCEAAIGSAIGGLSGKKGKNSTSAIFAQCGNSKTGALTRKYKLSTLRKAAKTLPDDIATYTTCGSAIASQINTLK